jgi:hypothetical protein
MAHSECAPLTPTPTRRLYVRNTQRRTTSTKSPTKHPRWRESFELPVHAPQNQELVRSCRCVCVCGGWVVVVVLFFLGAVRLAAAVA